MICRIMRQPVASASRSSERLGLLVCLVALACQPAAKTGPQAELAREPGGARLAVSFVVNIEEGAELSIAAGDERNEFRYEALEEVIGAPDPCMESHFGYGPRQGYQRTVDAFAAHGAKATFSTCGRAAEATPWLIEDAVSKDNKEND